MRSIFLALACLAVAFARQIPLRSSATSIEPCARASASSASYLAATPTAAAAVVDGQLFHECLQSVPIHREAALDLLQSLEPYIKLQSTLAYLANSPDDYQYPAIDILASLHNLTRRVTTGGYAGEYEFQTDLYRLFLTARDGHFSFIPDLFGVGTFKIPDAALVSVSLDGIESPRVYFRSDILDGISDGHTLVSGVDLESEHMPSYVVQINGISASDYLTLRTDELPFHDVDAAYNFLFSEISQIVQFGAAGDGAFVNPVFYPGPETIIEFANGTSISVRTVAEIATSFDNVTDGLSAYNKFCVREAPEWIPPWPSSVDAESAFPFYPEPVVKDSGNHIAGYFLDGDVPDNTTAILSILNFDALNDIDAAGFQSAVAVFLEKCKLEGKRRLIIDVFANGGGMVELGLDLFVQLFPNLVPASHANMRASIVLNDLGLGISRLDEVAAGNPFDVRSMLTIDGSSWSSWSQMYGHSPKSDTDGQQGFDVTADTSAALTNLFQPDPSVSAPPGFQITPANASAEPLFDPENIVFLTDGYCASTCAVFAEVLKTQTRGRVRSVVVGGRPNPGFKGAHGHGQDRFFNQTQEEDESEDQDAPGYKEAKCKPRPMQALGTTKGRAFWSFNSILASAQTVVSLGDSAVAEHELGAADVGSSSRSNNISSLSRFTDLPLRRTFRPDAAGVNGMNHIRVGNGVTLDTGEGVDDSKQHQALIPLQFVREDADVRLFFTHEMLVRQDKVWERVARTVFSPP
ncbi:hypothetical protein A1O1_04873 [Capronia coronata CBS 617.96]|uniref:CPAF-like PDZ domain-containing protein n=1 Tax=Capronia coronata CBS 617.96 TaxID=1182541 RepID=W9YFC3_9EURO|nr:uncharacterized protein A1O1_04873 [Capronia coronata CBS 617.96]EXJ87946.1 hypothetical protein A1O1_04873 [Capronia coronata CBS 617.96]